MKLKPAYILYPIGALAFCAAALGMLLFLDVLDLGGFNRIDRVILISVDTLRADHLGCYNEKVKGTPAINSLARRGLVFERALCNLPKTTPSHATMLSGLYSWSHGVRNNNLKIPEQVVLLPEVLKEAGFATGAFVSLSTVKGIYGFSRGFDVYDDNLNVKGPAATGHMERRAEDTLDAALAWLHERIDKKVFLFIHLADPHGPYTPPEKYTARLGKPGKDVMLPLSKSNYARNAIPRYQIIDGRQEADFYLDRYMAEIRYVDDCLAKFFQTLKSWKIYKRSLIIFTSDHGEALGEHQQWFQHGSSIHQEQVWVPLVVAGPGVKSARAAGIVETVDIAPTVIDILGLTPVQEMEGRSFIEQLENPARPTDGRWYGDLIAPGAVFSGYEKDGFKLIHSSQRNTYMLYDVRQDPEEKQNLYIKNRGQAGQMHRHLKKFIKTRKNLKARRPALSERQKRKEREAMKSLGYLDE